MQKTYRVLHVFLSSPSDVSAERKIAEEVVRAVNSIVEPHLGWHVDLQKWEDIAPAFIRPQEAINPMVCQCDLFIGLLWKRWGTPTGRYSSGFEEEYELAKANRKIHGKPEIWLVFRSVSPDLLDDPGEGLKKVLEFRKRESGDVLFKEVHDAEDWKDKLQHWLLEHVLRLALSTPQSQPPDSPAVFESPETFVAGSTTEEADKVPIPKQLRKTSALLAKALESRTLEFSSSNDGALQEFEVVRLFLLLASLVSHRYTSEILGTHEMNLFFKHREQFELTPAEEFQLLRTIVSDADDLVPGWFWFKAMKSDRVQNSLILLANRDSSDAVRARSLSLLTAAKVRIPSELSSDFPLADNSSVVREAALDYLVSQENESAFAVLEKLAAEKDQGVVAAANEARLSLLIRLRPREALAEIVAKDQYPSADQLRALEATISEIDTKDVMEALKSSWEEIRRLAFKELLQRGALSVEVANQFASDPALEIRAMAFQALAMQAALPDFDTLRQALKEESNHGKEGLINLATLVGPIKPRLSPDLIIITFYRTQSTEQLLEAVDWYSVDGPLAYRALAMDRFDTIATELRTDLANGFERIRKGSLKREEERYGAERWKRLAANFEKYDDSIRSRFLEAGLIGLAENAQPGDADLARPYLTHTDSSLRDPAVKVISKVGSPEDAGTLLKIAEESYGDIKQEAAAAALKLSADPLAVARELMQNSSSEVVNIAFRWLFIQDSSEARKIFEELLNDGNDINRVRAIYYFSRRWDSARLVEFLRQYTARGSYYYNVVTWLDRLLYSPTPLREMFVKNLEQNAT